jgi:hypothetical protein
MVNCIQCNQEIYCWTLHYGNPICCNCTKEVSEENVEKMKEFLNIILVDLEKFVEI